MPVFEVTAGHSIARHLALGVFVACSIDAQASDAQKFIDWKSVPQSQAPDRLAEGICELEPVLAGQAILVLPLQMQAPRPPGSWNLECYLRKTLDGLLQAAGMKVVDAAPVRDQIGGIKGPYDKLAPKMVKDLADGAQANFVLAWMAVRGTRPAIRFLVYDGQQGKSTQMLSVNFHPTDLDYLACTPPANRAFIQWCEENFDKKIDRGECWDLPAKGIRAVGSSWGPGNPFDFGRQLDADETPFPGDPLASKDRRHTMVTYQFTGDGKIIILHQNWDWGRESGRKIGWGSGRVEGHDFWRVRPREGEQFEDILRAARTRPERGRGVTKPKAQRAARQPSREAEPPATEAAAFSAD